MSKKSSDFLNLSPIEIITFRMETLLRDKKERAMKSEELRQLQSLFAINKNMYLAITGEEYPESWE